MEIFQAVLAALLVGTSPSAAQRCPAFVPMTNSTGLNTPFIRVQVGPDCPNNDYPRPKTMHWHISYANSTDLALTVSDTSLLTPKVADDILSFDFVEGLSDDAGEGLQFGAEILLPTPGSVATLQAEGSGEEIYFEDTEGALASIILTGKENKLYVKTESASIDIRLNGNLNDIVLEGANTVVQLDIGESTVNNDVRLVVASVTGAVGGSSNRLLIVGNVAGTLTEQGIRNEVYVNGPNGCDGVDDAFLNDCDSTDETAAVPNLSCLGPAGVAEYCRSAAPKSLAGFGILVNFVIGAIYLM